MVGPVSHDRKKSSERIQLDMEGTPLLTEREGRREITVIYENVVLGSVTVFCMDQIVATKKRW